MELIILQLNPTWNQTQYTAFQKVMDEFQKFDNTAGFFVGNEVLTTGNNSIAAPYVKAAARDMKAYRNSKNYRQIPIGYSAGKSDHCNTSRLKLTILQPTFHLSDPTSKTILHAERTRLRLLTSSP